MNVSKVKIAAAGIAFAALAVATANTASAEEAKRVHQKYDCSDQAKCNHGQRAILPYVINPYQVYQSEEDGVHYFKGGSGLGYGYPYYDTPEVNYPDTNYFVSYPGESSLALVQPQFLNMDRPDRQHLRRHLLQPPFSTPGVNLPIGHGATNDTLEFKKQMKPPEIVTLPP